MFSSCLSIKKARENLSVQTMLFEEKEYQLRN